jgi:plasmid stabilization system protein ParE
MRIIFREQAEFSLKEIRIYLSIRWTRKELVTLKREINTELENISLGLVKHQKYSEDIYYTFVGKKNVKMFYTLNKDEILVLDFFNVKRNPESIRFK